VRRLPAFIIVIVFVFPVMLAALFTVGISTWVLDRGFYTGLLSDERLYEIPDISGGAGLASIELSGLGAFNTAVSPKALREILTPSYLRAQATSVVNQAFDIIEDRSRTDDITVDLLPVKTALVSDAGTRFARALANSLPVGGSASSFVMSDTRLPATRPASVSVDRAAGIIQAGLPRFAKAIPDVLSLRDEIGFRPWSFPWGARPHVPVMGIIVMVDVVLLAIAFGFLVAAGFTGGATLYGRLQWWGWGLIAPALLVLAVGVLTMIGAGWAAWGISSARMETQGFSASFVSAVIEVARHVITRVGIGFLATGAIACAAGFSFLGWSWSLPREERIAKSKGE
jgi:hypothetical protein